MNIAIIGCGGVASYLFKPLVLQFQSEPMTYFLVDADVVKAKNLARQNFRANSIGKNKAFSLIHNLHEDNLDMLSKNAEFKFHEEYFTEDSEIYYNNDFNPDVIIACVDNNDARATIVKYCRERSTKTIVIFAANEVNSASMNLWHSTIRDEWDITKKYPQNFTPEPKREPSCADTPVTEQTSAANLMAAAMALFALLNLKKNNWNTDHVSPFDLLVSTSNVYANFRDDACIDKA